MTIGKRIKQVREQLNLTMNELAERIGVATQTIFKYENEIVTNIPLEKIEKLSVVLEVTPAFLMGWDENAKEESDNVELSNLSKNVIAARQQKQLTQTEFSEQSGISLIILKQIEEKKGDPKLSVIRKISQFTGFSESDLLSQELDIDNGYYLYNQLDSEDKAEIRGEMKQMLKADKYN